MTTIILDELAEEQFLAERRATGQDRFDEVWDGVYIVSPDPSLEHQHILTRLVTIMDLVARMELGARVYPGCNVSDRDEDWRSNYRRPDLAVFMPGNTAIRRTAHTIGGPDFAIEIASPKDRTWDKLDFYALVNTRELLIVDRDPWKLTLLRLVDGEMTDVGSSEGDAAKAIASQVVPLSFRLIWRNGNPEIEVKHTQDGRVWHAPAVDL